MEDTTNKPVRVRFSMSQEIWDIVVLNCKEKMFVEEERGDDFTIVYDNEEDFAKAVQRFDGRVEFQVSI